MKVLVITGDKNFKPGAERYELQKGVVDEFAAVYWGRGSVWPKIPAGFFDVVSVQDPFWRGLFGWYIAKRIGSKLNVQVHTDLSAYSFVKHVLAKIILHHADSVRVVSEKIQKQVEHMQLHAPVTVLPVFVDVSKFSSVVRQEHTQKIILWIGRFEDEKDPLAAIAVLEEILQSGVDATLVMLGQGSLKEQLSNRANGNPAIKIHGWEDARPYLAQADVVLSTSKHESWGASMVEALAAGVPVVAPDVGVAKEAGAIVVSHDALAKAVSTVLTEGTKGQLQLQVLSKEQWATAWKQSLT